MSEDRKNQDDLLRLNRSLRLLSSCNYALFRANSEAELLPDICRWVVSRSGYQMVWIGLAEQDEYKSFRLVSSCGMDSEYLDKLNLSWVNDEKDNSPAAKAVRTGVTQVNLDLLNDPAIVPWYEIARAHGYRASIALPLFDGKSVLGVLSIYASEIDAFNPDEVSLLEELASNLACGISILRERERASLVRKLLKRSQAQYQRIVEMTSEGVWSLDADRNTDFVNTALCEKLGYRLDEMIGHPVWDFVFEEDKAKLQEEVQRRQTGESNKYEQRFRRKDGSELWGLVYGTPLMNKSGRFQGAFAMVADITDRRQSEAALKKTTQLLENIVEYDPDVIFLKRASDLRFEYFNRAAEEATGIKREQILNHSVYDFFPKEQADIFSAWDREAMQSDTVLDIPEYEVTTPRGPRILHSKRVVLRDEQDQPVYLLEIAEDITELKQAEARLLEQESHYRTAIETSPDGFCVIDMQGRIVEINDAYISLSGYSREELLGMPVSTLEALDTAEKVAERIAGMRTQGHARFESQHRKKSGTLWPVQVVASYSPAREGLLFVFITDLTGRKEEEETLRLQAEILAQMKEGIHIVRASDYTIVYSTPVFDRMFGYERNELIGKPVSILNAPSPNSMPEETAARINKALVEAGYWQGEISNIRKDGTRLTCWVKISGFEHHEFGRVWVAMHEDITERKRVELELQKARESVYRDVLVREVHHRIKNNLQGVIGVLRLSSMADPRLTEPINEAISQIESIALLHGLQGRAKNNKVGLCELTSAIANNAKTMLNRNIIFDIPETWKVSSIVESEAVPVALILNELITNAGKHGAAQGDISIHLRNEPDEHDVTISIYNVGTLPEGFGLNKPAQLGTGLQLVSSLMPHTGAQLYWKQQGEKVATIFTLSKPTIRLESYSFSESYGGDQ